MMRVLPPDDEAAARHRRNSIYNHPSSKQARAEDAAERRGPAGNPIAALRIKHLAEKGELTEKHQAAGKELLHRNLQRRNTDSQVLNGGSPQPAMLKREATERQELSERQKGERAKMTDRHRNEMSAALDKYKARAE